MRHHPPPPTGLHGRHPARVAAGVLDRGAHQADPGHHHVVGNRQVTGDTDAASDHASLADRRAAGNPHATRNGAMGAYGHVVAYLYLIIQLHPMLDHGVIDRAPIHGGVCPDLHVVADLDAAHLRHLHPSPRVGRETEAIGAYHGSGVQNTAPADPHSGIYVDARDQVRTGADARSALHDAAGADDHALADVHIILDHGKR